MSDADYNPNDPEFLASCARDEYLAGDEQHLLQEALRFSGALRTFSADVESLDALIGWWANDEIELDWATHEALINARIDGDVDERALARVDALLARWGMDCPRIEQDRIVAGVMRRVMPARAVQTTRRRVIRIGASLAAAAAVTLMATGWLWERTMPQPFIQVRYVIPDQPSGTISAPGARIRFDRTSPGTVTREVRPRVAMLAMGASLPGDEYQKDIPPP